MRSSGVFERIIAGCNDVQVMLDDNHRIAQFDQPIELSHQSLNVRWMQPGGRFIQNIQRASALVALQFCREFYTLRFAARQFSCGLPQPQVSQTDLLQNHEGMSYLRLLRKELACAVHCHRQNFRDVSAAMFYFQCLRVVACSVASRAGCVYARHEQQFHTNEAFAFAGFTPALSDVEREPAGRVMPGARGFSIGEGVDGIGAVNRLVQVDQKPIGQFGLRNARGHRR